MCGKGDFEIWGASRVGLWWICGKMFAKVKTELGCGVFFNLSASKSYEHVGQNAALLKLVLENQ